MTEVTEQTGPTGIELIAKLSEITPIKKLIKRKDQNTGKKVDDFEIVYTMKVQLKRQKLDRDENIAEGTGDPWGTLTLGSMDENSFKEFAEMKMGDEVLINVLPL